MTIYRFTAVLTNRPFVRTLKGSVKVIGDAADALGVVRDILKQEGDLKQGTSLKITISPSRKKA